MKECEKEVERNNRKYGCLCLVPAVLWRLKRKGGWRELKAEMMKEFMKEKERKVGRKNRRMEKYMRRKEGRNINDEGI
jgi:hypothetical protein